MRISEAKELFATHFRVVADNFALSPSAANWLKLEDAAYALQFIRFGPFHEVDAWCSEPRPVRGVDVLSSEIANKQRKKLSRFIGLSAGGTGA